MDFTILFFLLLTGSYLLRENSYEIKTSFLILIFYSAPFLFHSNNIAHTHGVIYNYNISIILIYSYTLFISALCYLFLNYTHRTNVRKNLTDINISNGEKIITLIAVLGVITNSILNWQHFGLIKTEYILAPRLSNLLILHLPVESILLASIIRKTFVTTGLRIFVLIVYTYAVILDFYLGYRMNLFFLILTIFYFFFRKYYLPISFISIILFGDFINAIKNQIQNGFQGNILDVLKNSFENFKILTNEQLNIFSNTFIGIQSGEFFNSIKELLYFIPLFGKIYPLPHPMSSDKLALLKNVDPLTGAGVGYSYQLFIYENFLIGSLLLGIVILLIHFSKGTVFSMIALELFFSMMRNSTSYWAGIFMKLILVIFFVYIVTFILEKKKDSRLYHIINKL